MITVICTHCNTPRDVKKRPRNKDNRCRSCSSKEQVQVYKLAKFRVCKTCGDKKRVNTAKEALGTICRECLNKENNGFSRVCVDCGDVKQVDNERDSKALRCKTCSAKEVARNRIGTTSKVPKKLYWYFCGACPIVQVKRTKQGGRFCITCNRKQPRRKNRLPEIYFDMKEMKMIVPIRHIRICPHCPPDSNTKDVQVARLAGIRPCRKHAYIDNPQALADKEAKRVATRKLNESSHKKVYKKKARKGKKVSKEAIEKQIQINRDHKRAQKEKETIAKSSVSPEDMIAKFLKTNKATIVGDTTPIHKVHYFNGNGLH